MSSILTWLSFWSGLLFKGIATGVFLFLTGLGSSVWDILGHGDLLGHLVFCSWFNFCQELDFSKWFCVELFWKDLPKVESFENILFESAYLFSIRDLISTFKACFASSFGEKISDLFSLCLFLLKKFGLRYGSRRRVIRTTEFLAFRALSYLKLACSYSLRRF